MEPHLPSRDVTGNLLRWLGKMRPVHNLRPRIQHFEDPIAGRQSVLQHVVDRVNLVDRHVKQSKVSQEGDELADR